MNENQVVYVKKSNKGLIAVIIVLVILLLGSIGYILYSNGVFGGKNDKPVADKEETKVANKLINFDISKCINNDLEKELSDMNEGASISQFLGSNFDYVYNDESKSFNKKSLIYTGNDGKTATIKFDTNVEEVFEGILSINMGTVYFFLLEDGTVEYMRYSDIYISNKFELHKLEGVSDIVKFDNISIQDYPAGSRVTTIAYKIDGTYYDLSVFGILKGDGVSR